MIAKPYYILIVAIALWGNVVRGETKPITGEKDTSGTVSIFVDQETGIEYIVVYGHTSAIPTITLRKCVWKANNGYEYLGISVNHNGVRKCVLER